MTTETKEATNEVTCRKCGATYVPNFVRDFYPDGADPKVGRCERCVMEEAFAPKQPVPIDQDKLQAVCRLGSGESCCSYLVGGGSFECAKGSVLEATIRERLEAGTMRAKGDNCQGPPDYKPLPV